MVNSNGIVGRGCALQRRGLVRCFDAKVIHSAVCFC